MMRPMRALVLEGGAMRGVFTAGVLDVFAERDEPPFNIIVGVSAGACCAASYLAGQHRRNYVVFMEYLTSRRFLDPLRFLTGGSVADMAYLLGPISCDLYPLDIERVIETPCIFEAVAADASTGRAAYLPVEAPDAMQALHATCGVPMIYRDAPVPFRGGVYFDGAMIDPVPFVRAVELGATSATVILTRPISWKAKPPSPALHALLARGMRNYPNAIEASKHHHLTSNESRSFLDNGVSRSSCPVRVFAPPDEYPVSRFTRSQEVVQTGYDMGRQAALSGGLLLGGHEA